MAFPRTITDVIKFTRDDSVRIRRIGDSEEIVRYLPGAAYLFRFEVGRRLHHCDSN
jgi:hypothetical protein